MRAILSALVLAIGITAACGFAEEKKKPATTKAVISNKKCPISGDDVDAKVDTVKYKDKTVGFCCDDCIDKFKKDPDKYGKDLK